jgi:hypothetical protein
MLLTVPCSALTLAILSPTINVMKTTETNLIPAEITNEMNQAANNAAKGIRDPERIKRARKNMDTIREQIRKQHGILDIGVPSLRELRDQ